MGVRLLRERPRLLLLSAIGGLLLAIVLVQAHFILKNPGRSFLKEADIQVQFEGGALRVQSVGRQPRGTEARSVDLRAGDEIKGLIDARGVYWPLHGVIQRAQASYRADFDGAWRLVVERSTQSGGTVRRETTLPAVPAEYASGWMLVRVVGLKVMLPLVCVLTGLLIGFARSEDPKAFLAALLFFSFSNAVPLKIFPMLPPPFREILLLAGTAAFSSWSYMFMRFFLTFPAPSPLDLRLPRLKKWLVPFPILFTLWNCGWAYSEGISFRAFDLLRSKMLWFDIVLDITFVALFIVGFVAAGMNLRAARSPGDRRRLSALLAGALGVLPALVLYVRRVVFQGSELPDWIYITAATAVGLFPLCFAYVVIRHRIFGIRVIARRGLQYALLSRGFLVLEGVALFALIFYAGGPLLGILLGNAGLGALAVTTAFLTALGILALRHANRLVMIRMDRRFFREQYDARRILAELGRDSHRYALEPAGLVRLVTAKIESFLHADHLTVFLRGSEIVRLPHGGDVRGHKAASHTDLSHEDFYCIWHLSKDGGDGEGSGDPFEAAALSAKSFTAEHLLRMTGFEPYAIDVQIENRRSRATRISRPEGSTPAWELERAVLDRFNMRLILPLLAHRRVLGFVGLGEKRSEEPYSTEDKDFLMTVAQQLSAGLVQSEFIREEAEQLKMKHELAVAREVQARMQPQRMPVVPGISYAGACQPANGVGGDFFDVLELGEGRLGFAIGDVSGKGVAAALLMASTQAMLRIHADAHRDDVNKVISDINDQLCDVSDGNRFVTMFYGVYDAVARTLTYVNAGHNPPMLILPASSRSVGARALLERTEPTAKCVRRLAPTGMVLGVVRGAPYEKERIQLHPGDLLVVFTDGVTEAVNGVGDEYGEGRLEELLRLSTDVSAEEIRRTLLDDLHSFIADAPQFDDVTFLAIKAV